MLAMTGEVLEAVTGVAARLGLGPVSPELVSVAEHSIVRLAPLPLVARVRSSIDAADARTRLAREIAVARHLVARGAPVTRPAAAIDPGPHVWARCAMTFWEFAPHRAARGRRRSARSARVAARPCGVRVI